MTKAITAPNGEDKKSTALVGAEPNAVILKRLGYSDEDIAGLTEEEQTIILTAVANDLDNMATSSKLRPSRFKIEHKRRKFVDSMDNFSDTLHGVVVFYHKLRGRWLEGDKHPVCSSQDAITGRNSDGLTLPCATCQYNPQVNKDWGNKGNCKEMRRLAIVQDNEYAPITLTLPPTSIGNWDQFISDMRRVGKPLIASEVELRLEAAEAKGQDFARIRASAVGIIPPKRIVELGKFQKEMSEFITSMAVESDDYPMQGDGATEAAATSPTGSAADKPFD